MPLFTMLLYYVAVIYKFPFIYSKPLRLIADRSKRVISSFSTRYLTYKKYIRKKYRFTIYNGCDGSKRARTSAVLNDSPPLL